MKLTDVSELTFEQAVESYWQLLNLNACVDAIALVAMTNNLVLDEQHNPELHAAMAKRYLRPEYREHLRTPLEADPHPTFRIAFSRLGSLLTLKLLISLLPDHATETNASEPYLAGDLAVLANEFTGSSSIREGNGPSPMELMLEATRPDRTPQAPTAAASPREPANQTEAPNDVMTIDYKGQFRLGNHEYCYPLTIVDGFSPS